MATTKNLTREIAYRWGSLKEFCQENGINEGSLRTMLSTLGAKSSPVENRLKELDLYKFLEMDRQEMINDMNKGSNQEVVNV